MLIFWAEIVYVPDYSSFCKSAPMKLGTKSLSLHINQPRKTLHFSSQLFWIFHNLEICIRLFDIGCTRKVKKSKSFFSPIFLHFVVFLHYCSSLDLWNCFDFFRALKFALKIFRYWLHEKTLKVKCIPGHL